MQGLAAGGALESSSQTLVRFKIFRMRNWYLMEEVKEPVVEGVEGKEVEKVGEVGSSPSSYSFRDSWRREEEEMKD